MLNSVQELIIQIFLVQDKIQFNLIWIDESFESSEKEHYMQHFQQLFERVIKFESKADYQHFMISQYEYSSEQKYFLLIEEQSLKELIEISNIQSLIIQIFVLCKNLNDHDNLNLRNKFSKIKLITSNIQELDKCFKSYQKIHNFQDLQIQAAYHFTDADKVRNYFFLEFVIELCTKKGYLNKERGLSDFKRIVKKYIEGHQLQPQYEIDLLKIMEDLSLEDPNTKIISWYTEETFFYPLINEILKKRDYLEIFQIRIAIFQLNRQLNECFIMSRNYPKSLYRGSILNKSELEVWKNYHKYPLMLHGFQSTTSNRDIALGFSEYNYHKLKQEEQKLYEKVLIEILIDTTEERLLPIQISNISSYLNEEEYLFKLNTLLIIEQIHEDQNQIFVIKARLSEFSKIQQEIDQNMNARHKEIKMSLQTDFQNIYFYLVDILWVLSQWNEMISILEDIEASNDFERAYIYEMRGQALKGKGELYKALEYSLQGLELKEKYLGQENIQVAQTYNNISTIYESMDKLNSALVYALKALEIKKKKLQNNDPQMATSYNNIAQIYYSQGNLQKALEFQLKCLDGEDDKEEIKIEKANYYNNIGQIYQDLDDLKKALEFQMKALQIWEKAFDKKSIQVATCYNNIGYIYKDMNDFSKALQFSLEALKILREINQNDIKTAKCYYNIGQIYWKLSQPQKSIEFSLEALNISINLNGQDNILNAQYCYNIGQMYEGIKDIQNAEKFYLKALNIRQQSLGENNPDTFKSYENQVSFYYMQSEFNKALQYQLKFLEIVKKSKGENHALTAQNYRGLAYIYEQQKQFQKAVEMLSLSYQIIVNLKGERDQSTEIIFQQLNELKKKI